MSARPSSTSATRSSRSLPTRQPAAETSRRWRSSWAASRRRSSAWPATPHAAATSTSWQPSSASRNASSTKREAEFVSAESLVESETLRLERRERRVVKGESTLAERLRELDEREDALELREAATEADQEIAGDKLDRRLARPREARAARRPAGIEPRDLRCEHAGRVPAARARPQEHLAAGFGSPTR